MVGTRTFAQDRRKIKFDASGTKGLAHTKRARLTENCAHTFASLCQSIRWAARVRWRPSGCEPKGKALALFDTRWRVISPSEAFLPPTIAMSAIPNSSNRQQLRPLFRTWWRKRLRRTSRHLRFPSQVFLALSHCNRELKYCWIVRQPRHALLWHGSRLHTDQLSSYAKNRAS